MLSSILSVFLVTFVLVQQATSGPVVETTNGVIEGETVIFSEDTFININKSIDVFRGIPFAEPPIGANRFRSPQPAKPWDGVYDASYFRMACPQPFISFSGIGEDCLYLNVFVPHTIPENSAVMVYMFGGAFIIGHGSQEEYSGIPMSAVGDVIVVTLNYRLGPFGFLTTGDDSAPGNYGVLDQVMALEWVQDNIQAFGGDPNQVTIFGQSAGGASVGLHLMSPLSQNLFQKAIMQSGVSLVAFGFRSDIDNAKSEAFALGALFNCSDESTVELMACLREQTEDEILQGGLQVADKYVPVIDGYFLHDTPQNLLKNNEFAAVDIMLGTNKDEGSSYALGAFPEAFNARTPPPMNRSLYEETWPMFTYGYVNDQLVDAVETEYVDWSIAESPDADYLDTMIRQITDQAYWGPTDEVARAHVAVNATVYLYYMTHVPTVSIYNILSLGPKWLGCTHAEDVPFVFGHAFIPGVQFYKPKLPRDVEIELSVKLMKYWTNFAKHGTPNGDGDDDLPHWPTFTIPDLSYKEISLDLPNGRVLKPEYSNFWNNYIPRLITFTEDLELAQDEWQANMNEWKEKYLPRWKQEFEKYKSEL
ncbi:acetylcholinesterase-like [Amphiura filiformis]|uniref:acetylcholinesterase-like n=1 Tax=Amphiura filiformis TaxID=82378 RepID=UPI003B2267EC